MLQQLGDELAVDVLARLAPEDVAASAAACAAWRSFVSRPATSEPLFARLAARRWARPRAASPARGRLARRLFTSANGWRGAALGTASLAPGDNMVAAAAWIPGLSQIAMATGDYLEIWRPPGCPGSPGAAPPAAAGGCARRRHDPELAGSCRLAHPEAQVYCLASDAAPRGSAGNAGPGARRLYAGDSRGRLSVYEWRGGGAAGGESVGGHGKTGGGGGGGGPRLLRELESGSTWPMVDVLPLGCSNKTGDSGSSPSSGAQAHLVASLHDGTFVQQPDVLFALDNCVRVWDVEAGREVRSHVTDPASSCQLVAMCQPDPENDPSTLLAAGFHDGFCHVCYASGLPSLCFHKPPVQSASLCVIDVRCPQGVTSRYSAMHRSIYPAIRASRGRYVFTSHCNTPMAAWDLRHMGAGPLYEERRLESPGDASDDVSSGEGERGEEAESEERPAAAEEEHAGPSDAPLEQLMQQLVQQQMQQLQQQEQLPEHLRQQQDMTPQQLQQMQAALALSHRALWLEASDDVLLGRDELGTVWCWDLSSALGWARDASPAPGAWALVTDTPWRAAGRRSARPVPIATFPSPQSALPAMLFPGEPSCELACLCGRPRRGAGKLLGGEDEGEELVLAWML